MTIITSLFLLFFKFACFLHQVVSNSLKCFAEYQIRGIQVVKLHVHYVHALQNIRRGSQTLKRVEWKINISKANLNLKKKTPRKKLIIGAFFVQNIRLHRGSHFYENITYQIYTYDFIQTFTHFCNVYLILIIIIQSIVYTNTNKKIIAKYLSFSIVLWTTA